MNTKDTKDTKDTKTGRERVLASPSVVRLDFMARSCAKPTGSTRWPSRYGRPEGLHYNCNRGGDMAGPQACTTALVVVVQTFRSAVRWLNPIHLQHRSQQHIRAVGAVV